MWTFKLLIFDFNEQNILILDLVNLRELVNFLLFWDSYYFKFYGIVLLWKLFSTKFPFQCYIIWLHLESLNFHLMAHFGKSPLFWICLSIRNAQGLWGGIHRFFTRRDLMNKCTKILGPLKNAIFPQTFNVYQQWNQN